MVIASQDKPQLSRTVEPKSRTAWRAWLRRHHAKTKGVWLILAKKHAGPLRLKLDDAIEEALCFGWIDSLPRKLDADRSMLWFAPRKPRSRWSRLNKQRVERLIAAGGMTPAGQAMVDAAKASGAWTSLDEVENLVIPTDLAAAFDRFPGSRGHFDAFPRSAKRGILEWILAAKRAPTRAARIEETALLAARNERAHQWKSPRT